MKRVKALCSIMHEEVWRVPGTETAIFEVTEEMFDRLRAFVADLSGEAVKSPPEVKVVTEPVEEVEVAPPKKQAARKPRKRTKK